MKRNTKIIRLGKTAIYTGRKVDVFCAITMEKGRLSISGVEGPKANGDAWGGCGQINMHAPKITDLAPGWTESMLREFFEIWGRWHLNDMNAGSPRQEAFLRGHPEIKGYDKACKALADAGLNPDAEYDYGGKPYSYGHGWIYEEVPTEVIEFLDNLPHTDINPAWV